MSIIFTDGTVFAQNKLGMVNDSLLSIGEVPLIDGTLVDSLPLGTDGDTARRIVETTMVEVQTRGWYFNTDYDFKLVPDTDGFISLPPTVLRVDFGSTQFRHGYTLRNGRIYDMREHTFKIDKNLEADIIWLQDYANLPPEAYEYISARAARKFQQKVIGSVELSNFTNTDETDAFINLQRAQLQSQDYNLRNPRVSTRTTNAYLTGSIFGAVSRR